VGIYIQQTIKIQNSFFDHWCIAIRNGYAPRSIKFTKLTSIWTDQYHHILLLVTGKITSFYFIKKNQTTLLAILRIYVFGNEFIIIDEVFKIFKFWITRGKPIGFEDESMAKYHSDFHNGS